MSDRYQPCSHECNGCPTCDPGLTAPGPMSDHESHPLTEDEWAPVRSNGLAGVPCVAHGADCDGSTSDCESTAPEGLSESEWAEIHSPHAVPINPTHHHCPICVEYCSVIDRIVAERERAARAAFARKVAAEFAAIASVQGAFFKDFVIDRLNEHADREERG